MQSPRISFSNEIYRYLRRFGPACVNAPPVGDLRIVSPWVSREVGNDDLLVQHITLGPFGMSSKREGHVTIEWLRCAYGDSIFWWGRKAVTMI